MKEEHTWHDIGAEEMLERSRLHKKEVITSFQKAMPFMIFGIFSLS
ncbi:MAG: hypothetical protein PF439_10560 [Helicobacteraceae bacterium]|nr:hypothetical protein [Helicobacteraceae bacterium]